MTCKLIKTQQTYKKWDPIFWLVKDPMWFWGRFTIAFTKVSVTSDWGILTVPYSTYIRMYIYICIQSNLPCWNMADLVRWFSQRTEPTFLGDSPASHIWLLSWKEYSFYSLSTNLWSLKTISVLSIQPTKDPNLFGLLLDYCWFMILGDH
jgi:hypothetical protein